MPILKQQVGWKLYLSQVWSLPQPAHLSVLLLSARYWPAFGFSDWKAMAWSRIQHSKSLLHLKTSILWAFRDPAARGTFSFSALVRTSANRTPPAAPTEGTTSVPPAPGHGTSRGRFLPPGGGSEPSTALVPPRVPSPPPGPACCAVLKMAAALRGLLRRAVSEGGKAGTSARLLPALTLASLQVPAAGRTLTAQPLLCARRRLTLGKRGAAPLRCAPGWQRGGGGPQCVMCPRRRLAARPGRHAARPVL